MKRFSTLPIHESWLAVIAIVATFAATYLGVYLGSRADRRAELENVSNAYTAMTKILAADCRLTMELNADFNEASPAPLKSPTLLYQTMGQNSLLLERMNEETLDAFIVAMNDTSFHGQTFQNFFNMGPGNLLPVPPPPMEGETPEEFQARLEQLRNDHLQQRLLNMRETHASYLASSEQLCSILEQESA